MLHVVFCRILYPFVGYFFVSGSGSITSVGEERANLSALVYLWFLFREGSSFSGCLVLLWHSLSLPYKYSGS